MGSRLVQTDVLTGHEPDRVWAYAKESWTPTGSGWAAVILHRFRARSKAPEDGRTPKPCGMESCSWEA